MKSTMYLVATIGLILGSTNQVTLPDSDPRRDFMQEFLKMELNGGRLTANGSNAMAIFFAEPKSFSTPKVIFVVSDKFDLEEFPADMKTSKISAFFHEYYGTLDETMRFTPAPKTGPGGGLVKKGIAADYDLVEVKKSNASKPQDTEPVASAHTSTWRILKDNAAGPSINIHAAMEYVKDTRERTPDPTVRKNADRTLAMLKNLS
ncbi:MAG TPA: hypothetical protein VKT53_08860 [Candidatus Acidoferrum sp.]|nr:hypothetical protein [Candidatus Acidoferrum sp.]